MPEVFQSERFFREAWPQISPAFASTVDAAAHEASVSLTPVCQDIRDMEFPAGFDLAVNLFSSIATSPTTRIAWWWTGSGAP
jgi:hypothetical protein